MLFKVSTKECFTTMPLFAYSMLEMSCESFEGYSIPRLPTFSYNYNKQFISVI